MLFLNPPGKRKGRIVKRKRSRRGKLRGAAKAAFLRRMASGRKKARNPKRKRRRKSASGYTVGSKRIRRRKLNPRRKRRGTTRRRAVGAARRNKGGSVARRKRRRASKRRRHAVARRNPRRHIARRRGRRSGRRLHRNPSLSVKGLTGQAVQGVKDAAAVLAGEAGTNIIANLVPIAKTGVVGIGVRLGAALATGFIAHKALGPKYAQFVVAGGFAAVLRPTLKGLGIPLISSNLGGIGAYPLAGLGDGEAYAALTSSGGTGQVPGAADSGLGYADMGFGDDGMGAYPMN